MKKLIIALTLITSFTATADIYRNPVTGEMVQTQTSGNTTTIYKQNGSTFSCNSTVCY